MYSLYAAQYGMKEVQSSAHRLGTYALHSLSSDSDSPTLKLECNI